MKKKMVVWGRHGPVDPSLPSHSVAPLSNLEHSIYAEIDIISVIGVVSYWFRFLV